MVFVAGHDLAGKEWLPSKNLASSEKNLRAGKTISETASKTVGDEKSKSHPCISGETESRYASSPFETKVYQNFTAYGTGACLRLMGYLAMGEEY